MCFSPETSAGLSLGGRIKKDSQEFSHRGNARRRFNSDSGFSRDKKSDNVADNDRRTNAKCDALLRRSVKSLHSHGTINCAIERIALPVLLNRA